MTLRFLVDEPAMQALSETRWQNAGLPERRRNKMRAVAPVILLAVWAWFTWAGEFSWFMTGLYGALALAWYFIVPRWLDLRRRRVLRQQLGQPLYAKAWGPYEVQILSTGLCTDGPLGRAELNWSSIHETLLTRDYLFLFFVGGHGLPIRVAEIGVEAAQTAHAEISRRAAAARERSVTDASTRGPAEGL